MTLEERLDRLQVSIWQQTSGLVTVEVFAREAGYSPSTIRRALTSGDPSKRLRWPEFRKSLDGGGWTTTRVEILNWWARLEKSSHVDPEVRRALAEVGI